MALKTPDYDPEPKRAWPSLVPDPCKRTKGEPRKKRGLALIWLRFSKESAKENFRFKLRINSDTNPRQLDRL